MTGPRRTRVLHVVANLNEGGLERIVADMIRRTDPARFDVGLLCLSSLGREAEGLAPETRVQLATRMGRTSMLRPATLAAELRAIAPDVLHTHSGVWYKATLAGRMAGIPLLVHTDHGRPRPDRWHTRLVDGVAARRTDVVVAVSDALKEELARSLHVPRSRLKRILNGVDTDHYRPRPDDGGLRAELGIAPDAPIIGSIGRLFPVKGYDLMLDAFARLVAGGAHPDAHLVIAGDGTERDALADRVRTLGLGGRAHLVGWRTDAPALLSSFTLFTMSSHSEGTSVSLLEAMSCGLPAIVTAVGGNGAVMGPDLRECLVPRGDADALGAAWSRLLDAPGRRSALGEHGRARVLGTYSLDAMVRAYEGLYAARAARPAPSAAPRRAGRAALPA